MVSMIALSQMLYIKGILVINIASIIKRVHMRTKNMWQQLLGIMILHLQEIQMLLLHLPVLLIMDTLMVLKRIMIIMILVSVIQIKDSNMELKPIQNHQLKLNIIPITNRLKIIGIQILPKRQLIAWLRKEEQSIMSKLKSIHHSTKLVKCIIILQRAKNSVSISIIMAIVSLKLELLIFSTKRKNTTLGTGLIKMILMLLMNMEIGLPVKKLILIPMNHLTIMKKIMSIHLETLCKQNKTMFKNIIPKIT